MIQIQRSVLLYSEILGHAPRFSLLCAIFHLPCCPGKAGPSPRKGHCTRDPICAGCPGDLREADPRVKPGPRPVCLEQRSFPGSGRRCPWSWWKLMSRKYKKQLEPPGKWTPPTAWRAAASRARAPRSRRSLVSRCVLPVSSLESGLACKGVLWSVQACRLT